ncbi:hypothetical protein [Phenylobacterium sp.]|uniref:hypothetical protein n=1 Tax=Phenylobacterium sp. TaxID=1871053 RepID=UPI003D296117
MGGDLGDAYRQIVMGCCRPIYWFSLEADACIRNNGTVTFLRTPERLIGITAAHVLDEYDRVRTEELMRPQIGNVVVHDLDRRRIATNTRLDIATIDLSDVDPAKFGNDLWPLATWPPMPPEEGRGIMLGGYPGGDRRSIGPLETNWGLFTALGIARTVSDDQITWIVPRGEDVHVGPMELPLHHDLGGISGGPLIASFESAAGLMTYRLAGIVSEAQAQLEYVVARRIDGIRADGSLV